MNEESIPAELHYTLSSASPNEALRRMRAAFEGVGTETVDMLGLVQEGTKLYYASSDSLATARRMKVAVGSVIAIAYEQSPERLHMRRLSANCPDGNLVRFYLDIHSTNVATQAAGEAPSATLVSSAAIKPSPSVEESASVQPAKESDAAAVEARRQWKSRFRARVRMMEKLLANAPDDNIPTPRGDGDN
jgi:hypothetical protein